MSKAILMVAYTTYASDSRVIREAEAALSAGFEVDFLALREAPDPPLEVIRGVNVYHLNQQQYRGHGWLSYVLNYIEFFIRSFLRTTLLHVRRRYQIIHVHNMPDFIVFCALIPKMTGAKVLLDVHDPMPETFQSKFKSASRGWWYWLLLWQERFSAWYADRVVTVHEPVKQNILVPHGLPAEKIVVVANFADEGIFRLREDIELEGPVRLAFHGTILERSGLGQLMVALAAVRRPERIRVKIIGTGDYSAELKLQIVDLGLSQTVEFINQVFPVTQVPAMLADCNVGVVPLKISPITNHALPLKLIEYIAMGMPVVSVWNAAISHYFAEDDCLFFKPNDVESLRALLDRLTEEPALLRKYREKSLMLRGRFLWENEKQKYMDLLKELVP